MMNALVVLPAPREIAVATPNQSQEEEQQQQEEEATRTERRRSHRRRHSSSSHGSGNGSGGETRQERRKSRSRSSSKHRGEQRHGSTCSSESQTFFSAVQKRLEVNQDGNTAIAHDDATTAAAAAATTTTTTIIANAVHRPVAMRIARPTARRIEPPSPPPPRRSNSTQSLPDLSFAENLNPNVPETNDSNNNSNITTTQLMMQQAQQQLQQQPIPVPMAMMRIMHVLPGGMLVPQYQHSDNIIIINNNSNNNNWNNVPRRRKKKRSPEQKYQAIKESWYHSIAAKNRLGMIGEDPVVFSDSDREATRKKMTPLSRLNMISEQQLHAKRALLKELNETKGDLKTLEFQAALQELLSLYDAKHFDPRRRNAAGGDNILEGVGISAGKPTFPGHVGYNEAGDPMYKLGTMSFGEYKIINSSNNNNKCTFFIVHALMQTPSFFIILHNRHVLSDPARHVGTRNLCLD